MEQSRLYALLFALLLLPTTHAALQNWEVRVDIAEDRTAEWIVNLTYDSPVARNDYFVLARVEEYKVLADGVPAKCSASADIGTTILCSNVNARNIVYTLKTGALVNEILQNFRLFTYKFSATEITGSFAVRVTLPLGAVLVEEARLAPIGFVPFEPASGRQGTDGRKIFIEWTVEKPQLGETLDVSVVYEQFVDVIQLGVFAAVVGGMALVLFFVLYTYFRREPVREIMPVLTDGERRIMEIILRERTVDQRIIVKETDFSKAKVSRLIHELAGRGLIEKVTKGRKNLISLKKSIKVESVTKGESKK